MKPEISDRELHTLIAALRYWQDGSWHARMVFAEQSLATRCESAPLTAHEIDALCERLNIPAQPVGLVIVIEGGLVQSVEIDGESVAADIHDYDVDGAHNPKLITDENGTEYILRHC